MGLDIVYTDGQTPLDPDEQEGLLIRSITTREELDEFEQQNIERAIEWTLSRKFKAERIFTEEFVSQLHRRMFGEVWRWAGTFRRTDKNIGCSWLQIGVLLKQLNDDGKFWLAQKVYTPEEAALRYKHRIVSIHCFANGNGRHSRLMADIIISHVFGKEVFTWGARAIDNKDPRTHYLQAVRKADRGDFQPLISFAGA